MAKLGIFVGSFNPPHMKHFELADKIIKRKIVDKIIFIPVNRSSKNLVDFNHRYNMIKLYTDRFRRLDVSDIERDTNEIFNYKHLNKLKDVYDDDIYIIMGSDNFLDFKNWENNDELIKDNKMVVVIREGYDCDLILNQYEDNQNITITKPVGILSSSIVRYLLKEDKSINGLVDDEIIEYIKKNNLYS